MIKYKLPKDWIAVTSKSHPDRVYYFNVKTNQSTWVQPRLGETNKTSPINDKKCKKYSKRTCLETMSGHNPVEDETTRKRHSCEIETPQMKAIREKMSPKLLVKNKSSSLKVSNANLSEQDRIISLKSSSNLAKNNKSVTVLDKNNDKITLTCENTSGAYKKVKADAKSKQQNLNQVLMKRQDKHENNVQQQRYSNQTLRVEDTQKLQLQNVSRKKESKLPLKKNLARERMQKLRKSLTLDKDELKEITIVTEKTKILQKPSTNLSSSYNDNSTESTGIYKYVEARVKRLRNKILKNSVYETSVTSNDKSRNQQEKELIINNMTKDKLIEQASQEVLYEEMDWEPMGDEEIALEVEVVRTQLCKENHIDETNLISRNATELTQPNEIKPQEKGPMHIVIDTNVFLSNLKIIEEARDATFKNYQRAFIVIPWTVITELDYFKNDKSRGELCPKARKAISFIHKHFSSKHPRVIGQTREQAVQNKEDFSLDCPDDEILQCCLQIFQLGKSVVLLSNDKNLRTKAMVYNILALGCHDSLEKIDYFDTNDRVLNHLTDSPIKNSIFNDELLLAEDIFENAKTIMKNFLSTIIVQQMSEIYGAIEWKIYVIIKPPWTIVTALKCAIKHWIAAISESFQRRAEHILKDLLQVFEHLPDGGRKLQNVEDTLEKCSNLIQMVNMDKYCELMTQTLDVIMELKKKCLKHITDIDKKKLHQQIGIAESVQEQEIRAEKVFQYFQHIYVYTRDICGLACSNAGMAHSFAFKPMDPPLSNIAVQRLRSEISKKVMDLTYDLNKLLEQAEYSTKYQTLLNLQHGLNTFLPDAEKMAFDVTPLDVYYCIQLKEEALKTGLRQLQELSRHFCALSNCVK